MIYLEKDYEIIYCDPPWSYRDKAAAGERGASFKYQTLSIGELSKLDVESVAAPNCALFLWVTMPLLREGIDLLAEWGFEYRTVAFVWVKACRKTNRFFFGMGNWTRANSEIVLLGVRGKPKRANAGVSQIIYSRIMQHSAKPKEVRERITKLMGDKKRLELFAREHTPGWHATGLELDGRDIRKLLWSGRR